MEEAMSTHPNYKPVNASLRKAFASLRRKGYFAKGGRWICCTPCAHSAASKHANQWVFWHDQDHDELLAKGEVYLGWHGDGNEIARVCEAEGLNVKWDGSEQTRLCVSLGTRN
jgi:hypothetical protein